jgi:hypothetical protein
LSWHSAFVLTPRARFNSPGRFFSSARGQSYNRTVRKTAALVFCVLSAIVFLLTAGCSSPAEDLHEQDPQWTPLAITPINPIPTPTATIAAGNVFDGPCLNDAEFIEDLTIPDLTEVDPGSELDKRWLVRNSGSCDWTLDYRLVNVSGVGFTGPDQIALYPARSETSAVWQVVVTAPQTPGEHISRWQAQAPDGTPFGDEVFLYIVVPTPAPTPTGRPTSIN